MAQEYEDMQVILSSCRIGCPRVSSGNRDWRGMQVTTTKGVLLGSGICTLR